MAKIIKKKFFEIDIPLLGEKCESFASSINELNNRTIKMDATRRLRGKSVNIDFSIQVIDGKATAVPKSLTLMPFFIKHMIHPGTDYIEDSFRTEAKDAEVVIKPFFITRKRVSRAVQRTIRNSAKNWLVDYAKTKDSADIFQEILSNQLQKPLGLKLKKIYPLAICEIRIFEIKKMFDKAKEAPVMGAIEVKKEVLESEDGKTKEVKEEVTESIEIKEGEEKEEKPKKKKTPKKTKEEKKE
jgi:ribosomal protein S3AE